VDCATHVKGRGVSGPVLAGSRRKKGGEHMFAKPTEEKKNGNVSYLY